MVIKPGQPRRLAAASLPPPCPKLHAPALPGEKRLQEIGGIEPLVFGQYGELSESFEGPIDALAVKGCDQAADHYLLDVGPGAASVQKRLPLRD